MVVTKINFFKSLKSFLCINLLFLLVFTSLGVDLKESRIGIPRGIEGKLKVKVNYTEGPNKADFFTRVEDGNFLKLGIFKNLNGYWHGSYTLQKGSLTWTNPGLDNNKVISSIYSGPYNIYLKINSLDENKTLDLDISQEDIKYDAVNIELANDKQINYWAKATSRDWLEIVKGKIFRVNDSKLFTIFQTTVYEGKTPIYAFEGKANLKRKDG